MRFIPQVYFLTKQFLHLLVKQQEKKYVDPWKGTRTGSVAGRVFCTIDAIHRKKRFTSFPSPAGMSLTKLPLGRNNLFMTSLFPPRESLVVTSRLGTGNSRTFFYGVCYDVSRSCIAVKTPSWGKNPRTKTVPQRMKDWLPKCQSESSTEYIFYCKRAILFLSSSKILTPIPIPLSARRVCPPPATKAGVQTRRAERGMGGQYFGRREK